MPIANKDTRERAVEAYKTGRFSQQQLAEAYCVHYKTIQNWLKADACGESQCAKARGRRPRIFNNDDETELIDLISGEPSITLEGIKVRFNKDCNVSVVHKTLLRLGITYKNSAGIGTRPGRYQGGT